MDKYKYAKGRRKNAVATVRLFEGKGESMVNDKPVKELYALPRYQQILDKPFELINKKGQYYFTAKVAGGGVTGQLGAIVHGISRALVEEDADFRSALKKEGLLRRDDRKKERKKTGLRKARKAPQYSKR